MTACAGSTGTISIDLQEEPGSGLLARVDRVRLELDNPPAVAEAVRQPGGGLALDLEIDAQATAGRLSLEAFAAGGELIGVAESGPLPLGAIDGVLALYLAPPLSIGAAPVGLEPPRAELGFAELSFGAILIGGSDASGTPVVDVDVYNVYDHDFQVGEDLPQARAGASVVAGSRGVIYIFGGDQGAGAVAAPLAFDTNIAPDGNYIELSAPAGLERIGAAAASVGGEDVVVAGDPAVRIDGETGEALPFASGPPIAGTITTSRTTDETIAVAVGEGSGATGAARIGTTNAVEIPGPSELIRTGHCAAATSSGDVLVFGGLDSVGTPLLSGLRYRVASRDFVVLPDLLGAPRLSAAVAVTDRFVVLVGGTDDTSAVHSDALVFDLATLELVATLPLIVGRTGAAAIALANGQVLIVGGRDADGNVIATIELFTPSL